MQIRPLFLCVLEGGELRCFLMLCKAYLDKIQTKKSPIFDKIQTNNLLKCDKIQTYNMPAREINAFFCIMSLLF